MKRLAFASVLALVMLTFLTFAVQEGAAKPPTSGGIFLLVTRGVPVAQALLVAQPFLAVWFSAPWVLTIKPPSPAATRS